MLKKIIFSLLFSSFLLIAGCGGNTQPVPKLTPQQTAQLYNPQGNTILGNPNGTVTLVEIFDYQCEYCRKMLPVIQKLVQTDPNVRVVLKEIVLLGPSSEPATRAALAAQRQGKYQVMRNALMTAEGPLNNQQIMKIAQGLKLNTKKLTADMNSPAITQQMQLNNNLADGLNIESIPVFIIANSNIAKDSNASGKQIMLTGQTSIDELEKLFKKVQE